MDYNAPSGSTDPNAGYVGKTASTIGSKVPPKAAEFPQREIVNSEKCAGLTPSNGDTTQIAQSIGRGLWIGTLGANANVLVGAIGGGAVPSAPGILQTLNPWTRLRGIALQTNSSVDVTLTVSGIGAAGGIVTAPLRKRDGATKPSIGDVPTLRPFEVQWDGTYFCFVGSVASDGSGSGGGGGSGSVAPIASFLAAKTSNQSLSNGTYTDITFPAATASFGTFDGVSFTAGVACTVFVRAVASLGTVLTGASYINNQLRLLKNGDTSNPIAAGPDQEWATSAGSIKGDCFLITEPFALAPGDTLRLQASAGATSNFDHSGIYGDAVNQTRFYIGRLA